MSLLWISFRIILGVNIGIGDARGGAGMIRRSTPYALQKFYCAEFLNRNAAPVSRRTVGLQATLALSAVLIAQNPNLSVLVPPQTVGTKQPRTRIVHRSYRVFVFYRCPDQTVNIFQRLNCAKRRPHVFRISAERTMYFL